MAEVIQIERPAPRLKICPVCKQPTHLGCDHALVEFKAEQAEKQRQANRASRKKAKENNGGDNIASVEKTEESSWVDPEDCKHGDSERTEFGWGHCPICMATEIRRLRRALIK